MTYAEWMNQHLLTSGNMPSHWSTWQAAERQALERAKQICEARAERATTDSLLGYGAHVGAHHCAVEIDEAIRALNSDSSSVEKSMGCESRDKEWISVADRVPEFGRFVLIAFADGGVDMSSRIRWKRQDGWFWEGVSKLHHEPPTHWMPLPEAPASSVASKED